MYSRKLNSEARRLRSLVRDTTDAAGENLILHGHWGRYLCVLVAGFLENAIAEIYSEFGRNASSQPVARFVERNIVRVKNPKAQTFIDVAGSFKQEWSSDLERFMCEGGRKEAIDSVISNRNLIAHGENVGITVVRVSDYLDRCIEVVEYLEIQCGFSVTYG